MRAIIDGLYSEYLDFLEDVCNIESGSRDKQGVDAVADYIADFARKSGYKVERKVFDTAGDCLLVDWVCDEKKPFIVLSAHMDTVFEKGAFGYPRVRRDDEFIYGPGVCDCKGGVAMAFLVVAALKKMDFCGCNIRVLLQSDEEVSSSLSGGETIKYICDRARGCKAFFNLEPKYPGKLTLERGGILHAKFTVIGKAAHSSAKEKGANAISEAALKIGDIISREPDSGISFNCGVINGGSASNIVPEKCEFHVEARAWENENYEKAKLIFAEIAEKQFIEGTKTTFEMVSERIPMAFAEFNLELLKKINEINEKHGFDALAPRKSLGGSDASYTTAAGIPTADGMGMIGYNLHSVEEKAVKRSLADGAEHLATIILELC